MKRIVKIFKSLTAYDHFLVFLIILSVLKITDVFIDDGVEGGIHFLKLGAALFVISSILFFGFKYFTKQKKKYQHALISTFLILLMLSHADPDPVRGILVMVLLYISKFFITYKKKAIFNPIVFAIGTATIVAMVVPFINIPLLDFSGIDIRFTIFGKLIPIALVPISLSLIFNVGRIRKHRLALAFIIPSLLLGFLFPDYTDNFTAYVLAITFMGVAIIVEPKTSPHIGNEQLIYGIAMAAIIFGLHVLKVPNALILGLLICNVLYFILKQKRIIKK
ncbi:MAG: hypothetical protein ACI87N_001530 [Flavobacteriales bacterium]|jgi:hypothetical protein